MINKRDPQHRFNLSRTQVRVKLSGMDGTNTGFAFEPQQWNLTDEEVDELRNRPDVAAILNRPLDKLHDAVRIKDRWTGITHEVVPIRHEGRPALLAHLTVAAVGALDSDDEPLSESHLATIALDFLESPIEIAIGRPGGRFSPAEKKRPDDETLLRVIRDAYAADEAPRRVLAARFNAALPTVDGWIKHARSLPNNNLPAAKVGRPRKKENP